MCNQFISYKHECLLKNKTFEGHFKIRLNSYKSTKLLLHLLHIHKSIVIFLCLKQIVIFYISYFIHYIKYSIDTLGYLYNWILTINFKSSYIKYNEI